MNLDPQIILLALLLLDPSLSLLQFHLTRLYLLLLLPKLLVIRILCLIPLQRSFPDPLLDGLNLQEQRLVVIVLLFQLIDLALQVNDQQVLLLTGQLERGGTLLREP